MDMLKKINKSVGAAATAMIIVGGTPIIVQAMPNDTNVPKVEAKAICKNIEQSIKNGTYEINNLNKKLYSDVDKSIKKQDKNNLKEEIKIKILKENSDDMSMAGQYVNSTVKYAEKNGKKYFTVTLNRMDWMKNVHIKTSGKEVTAEKKENGNIGEFTFEIVSKNAEVMMHMNVVPMGNAEVKFRIVPEIIATAQVKDESKKEDTQAKDNQKPKENIKQTGKKDKDIKKDKTDKKSEVKWEKIFSVPEINSIEFGKFYGEVDKYRVQFKQPIYDSNMKIYVGNFEKVIVNGVEYVNEDSVEKDNRFYFGAMGLDLNQAALKDGINTIILKAKGYNDSKLEISRKKDKSIKIIKQEEAITESKDSQKNSANQVKHNIKDGIYSIGFTAYKVEDRNETSMLNNFFDKKAKLEVKDGKMKITLLNIYFADGIYDFRIENDKVFGKSVAKGYGKLDSKRNYPFKTFETNISDIELEHQGCVLVGPMGGLISDIGNFDKYRKVIFVFNKDNLKEWSGFDEDHKQVDEDKEFNKALLKAKLDKDGDNIVTNEELALVEGEVNLARKGIKDISRFKFLGKNVTSLDLTGNEIAELPEGVFNNLTKLIKLDIHGNNIKKLPQNIFDKLTELTELHIGMNEFKELPKGIFDKLTKLKKLSIYNNSLNNIEDNLFNNLKNLEYLSLEETGIYKIPQGIFKLINLKTLNLNKNQLKVIPKELANLKNLTWLDLGTNYIEEIPDEVYKNLNQLTMFDVKDNQLTKIPSNIWDLIPKNNRIDCSFNKLIETPKLADSSKGKKFFAAYPQKQVLNLKLNAKDGEISWTQDISSVNLIAWWRLADPFDTKKIPETLDEYKKQLGNKTVLEFLLKGSSEAQIITKIQKKDINGNYKTIKEITNYNEDDHSDKFKDPNMKDGDEYRILKRIGFVAYGSETYVCTDVYYTKAKVNGNHKEDTTKPVISIEKPAIYEGKITLNVINEDSKKIINKYLDLNEKIDVEVKNKELYMTLKLMSKKENIKKLQVDGDKVEFEVVGEEVKKINKYSLANAVVLPKVETGKESTTIRFKIPNETAKVKVTMNDKNANKDESFEIKLKEDTIKEVSNIAQPTEKPSTIPSSTSHKHKKHRKESKEDEIVKSNEEVKDNKDKKEDKKDDSKEIKDTNAKEDKNNDIKPNNNTKDNDSEDKKDKEDKKDNNVSEKKESNDIKKDSSKKIAKETKNNEHNVTSKEKSSSVKNTERKSNKKSTEIKEKKLPQTGMPFGSGLLGTIGSVISGLGVVLMRKNKNNK